MVNQMLNKQFLYGSHITTVLDYDINEVRGRFYLFTDRREEPYDRPLESADAFLKKFSPVLNVPTIVDKPVEAPQMLGTPGLAGNLREILLDNIERLKNDKEYIPQAEAINENVKTMIDLAKTEVAYLAVLAKQKRNNEDF